jgi:hypothetical protein
MHVYDCHLRRGAADCKGVSDLTLLAIAEAKMNPGLRDLNLMGCYDVTDTGVSWLAERVSTIVCLNVLVRVVIGQ